MSENFDTTSILTRDFIESVKSKVAEEFGVKDIELVGSYRRNEAKPTSDVDFLILDDSRPRDMKFLEMIGRLEEELQKEVGLVTVDGLYETDMKKTVSERMRKDLENYS